MTTILYDDNVRLPGTHVLIVGVGHYPHLQGGGDALQTPVEGLTQLGGAAPAAMRMARWFLESFRNEALPLRSLGLLVSAPEPVTLAWERIAGDRRVTDAAPATRPPEDPRPTDDVARATYANFEAASARWFDRGDEDKRNQVIFFFSGHGLGDGALVSLLLRDFAATAGSAGLTGMLDLNDLRVGMRRCRARRQVWFIDACRKPSRTVQNAEGYLGKSPIAPGPGGPPEPCHSPMFHSTMAGSEAFGLPSGGTVFTEALLSALRGGGSLDLNGNNVWHVTPHVLHQGLEVPLRRAGKKYNVLQIASADSLTLDFTIHTVDGMPRVPVFIECDPEGATGDATLRCERVGTATPVSRGPRPEAWELELEVGRYRMEASFEPPTSWSEASREVEVRPPTKEIALEVHHGGP